jgi:ribonucleoside-diphosphate reductase beta chain
VYNIVPNYFLAAGETFMTIFDEQVSRKPDLYSWTQDFIEAMHNGFWTDKEFSFQSDIQDFKVALTDQEKEIIIRALATIGQLEISVKKFWAKLGDNLPHPSINDMGYVMANTEVIHGDAYERLLEVLGIDDAFDKILELDIIKGRVNYLRKHLHKFHSNNKKQFIYSLILFTLFVENIALFSQFYTISWFGRYKNLLKDTNKQVEYTSREENLHAMIGMKIINVIRQEYPDLFDQELEDKILSESKEAVKYELQILEWVLNGYNAEKLNSEILKEFIKNRMNESLKNIGYTEIFEVNKELLAKTDWFDEQVLGNNMSDFFHSRPVEYSKKSKSFSEEDLF